MKTPLVLLLLVFVAAQSLAQVQVNLYSPGSKGGFRTKVPGRDSWWGPLWIDHREIGQIVPGKFVTLTIPEGDHSFAGQRAVNGIRFGAARESSIQTVITLHQGAPYYVSRLTASRSLALDRFITLPNRSPAKKPMLRLPHWSQ
jgi:hypothetical protein